MFPAGPRAGIKSRGLKPDIRFGLPAKEREVVMHVLAGAAATAIATLISFGADAADLSPPPAFGQPQYGMAPPPPIAPPQVIIVPGPNMVPRYPSAALPPPPVAPPPGWGVAPPISPRADVPPRAVCPLTWRCGEHGCGWQPNCAPPPERYSGQYEPPGAMYPPPGPPGPPVYSEPNPGPASEPHPDPYASRGYPGPTGPY